MFLTKECDYGIRIIRALADGEKRTVQSICETEYIPQQYAYKILKKLERGGLVQSRRGPDGGYQLTKSPGNFSIYDVITAVEEKLFISECLMGEQVCTRNTHEEPCAVHRELIRIQDVMVAEMKRKSMEEVLGSTIQ